MRRNHLFLALGAASLLIGAAGCGSKATVIDTNSDAPRVTTIENIDPQDWVAAVVAGANNLLGSDALVEMRQDTGKKPLVMVSTIRNKTKRHIDTQLLTERLTEAILNSRQAGVTTAVAADDSLDKANKQLRDLEYDEDFDQDTVMQRGTLKSPDVSLSGTIIEQAVSEGRNYESSYFFNMVLTNNRTGEVIWKYSKEIVKQKTRSWFGD